jgi:hypothetical protein
VLTFGTAVRGAGRRKIVSLYLAHRDASAPASTKLSAAHLADRVAGYPGALVRRTEGDPGSRRPWLSTTTLQLEELAGPGIARRPERGTARHLSLAVHLARREGPICQSQNVFVTFASGSHPYFACQLQRPPGHMGMLPATDHGIGLRTIKWINVRPSSLTKSSRCS